MTWVFMVLGVLALDFARYMRDDAVAALNLSEETRNYYVAVAAMNRAIYDLEQADQVEASADPAEPTRLVSRREASLASCSGAACAEQMDDDDEGEDDDGGGESDGDDEEDDGLAAADGEWHEDVLNQIRYGVRVTDEGSLISLNDA
ncbi:MAG: hypothetical protein ACREKH_17060, partial [Candidatus Rokuibacteriota bacterium]